MPDDPLELALRALGRKERSTAELQYRVSMIRQEDKNSVVEDQPHMKDAAE